MSLTVYMERSPYKKGLLCVECPLNINQATKSVFNLHADDLMIKRTCDALRDAIQLESRIHSAGFVMIYLEYAEVQSSSSNSNFSIATLTLTTQ